ncbi:type II toxin-antitoxin system death-on-curing family toxin [Solitalea lacus]|uniref:type II toxin-antitoxin system death-on-curing family toxin n=1 Tax=Solitalea lacus TaxID=2911172 RepID=UPI001EDA1317|nr:type II toxin-antitoxin system death-on-curing family toxin [Solitalea lacus]UKJ07022.1 type II toxin-antitoxin system death-on-curing family toxin [Solitalea lacus]
MIDLKDVENIHNILIDKFGGSKGIRDLGALQAAISRPFTTFDKQDLYPTVVDKAAAILESTVINHPFIDGNKRTAYVLMRLILLENGMDIVATQEEKYDMVIAASKGEFRFDHIKHWLTARLKQKNEL